ncbi:MAG TPA: sulfur transferase domain-containing protein [Pyrinomonadaceae bacterium]|nr:sulfur transferase domain-containing protein [Pyrinomonadaceae bacterium]
MSERLFRGAQPRAGGIRRLAELGIDTVVNLRGAGARTRSDEAEARALGLNYFNVPLPMWGRPDDARVRRVVEIIAAPESGRVFVHCKDGVDRTGTVVALYRIGREGWATGDALAEAERRGMRRIQYWMRDYVEDYGRRLRAQGAEAAARQQGADEDLGDRVGAGIRVAERKVFRARKVGGRVLRRAPGAIGGFMDGIF